jgi:cytochrome oxidase Cu insertion factor (SCO1/SenC/PrrC family)
VVRNDAGGDRPVYLPEFPEEKMTQSEQNAQSDNASSESIAAAVGRRKLIALMAIYAAPLIAAWLWLGYVRSNDGAGVSVNGELIQPAVPLKAFELRDSNNEAWGLSGISEKWSMVYFADETCAEVCEQTLYNMRQVRLSTGRRMQRVQRVLVTPNVASMAETLSQASEGLVVVGGEADAINNLKQQVNDAQAGMPPCQDCVYLVDPFANVMMRFPPDLDPKKMLKDLKHLLKVSRIG